MKRDYWIKSTNKPLKGHNNRNSGNWGKFFCLYYIQLTKLLKIVWHKHDLVISSLVGFGHPDKYSYEITHEYLLGWGNLPGKIISIRRNH